VTSLDARGGGGGPAAYQGGMRGSMVVAAADGGDPLMELVCRINHRRRQLVMRHAQVGVKLDGGGPSPATLGARALGSLASGGLVPMTLPALRSPSNGSSTRSSRAGSAQSGRGGGSSVSSAELLAAGIIGGRSPTSSEDGAGSGSVDGGASSPLWEQREESGRGGGARSGEGLTSAAVAVCARATLDASAISRRKAFDEQLRARAAELEKGYKRVLDKVKAMKSDNEQRQSDREAALLALAEKAKNAMRRSVSVRKGKADAEEAKASTLPSPARSRPASALTRGNSLAETLPAGLGAHQGGKSKDALSSTTRRSSSTAGGTLAHPRLSPRAANGEEENGEENKGQKYRKTEAQLISAARLAEQRILQRKKRDSKAADDKRPADEALQRLLQARAEAVREKEMRRHMIYLLNRLMRESEDIRVKEFMARVGAPAAAAAAAASGSGGA